MRVVVTGSDGFLGRHVRIALRAAGDHDVIAVNRERFQADAILQDAVADADAVIHVAGVNRGRSGDVEEVNVDLARRLVAALDRSSAHPVIVYGNSVRADIDEPYGRGKRRAAEILHDWADRAGAVLVDLHLCNVFGEGGRPHYNSVVATFCHQLVVGETPTIVEDRTIELVHAQDVAAMILRELNEPDKTRVIETTGRALSVSDLLQRLRHIRGTYETGRIPDLSDPFDRDLFNAYRSYLYPGWYPRPLRSNRDQRGNFVEIVQSLGGQAQTSFSTTAPGVTRGEHYHLRKVERFVVLAGRATMAVRPVLGTDVTTYAVDGDTPVFVDMPTLCAHNISNVGNGTLYTAFWTNEIFDPAAPDTYPEQVS